MDEKLRELKERGSFLFPFESYHTHDLSGNFYVSCHWHPDTEIIHLQKGAVRLFIDGESYLIDEETIVFINREELHYLYSVQAGTLYDAAVFPLEFLSFDSLDYCQQKYLLPLIRKELGFPRMLKAGDPCFDEIRQLLIQIANLQKTCTAGYQIAIKAFLYQLLSRLIQEDLLKASADENRQWNIKKLNTMKEIAAYMEAHLAERLSLEDVSAHFYMSQNYFCKYFKQNFGTGFTSYLNNLRLEQACVLLEKTDLPIMEVSLQCGFENFSYFIRLFKRLHGITPSAYRKKLAASSSAKPEPGSF